MSLFTRLALTLSVIVFLPLTTLAQPFGLETDNPRRVALLIEVLNDHAKDAGLNEIRIGDHIQLRLRAQGVQITQWERGQPYLYVKINVLPPAYHVTLEFNRRVYYPVRGSQEVTIAPTWNESMIGYSMPRGAAMGDHIMTCLDKVLDRFMADFFKVHDVAPVNTIRQ